MGIHVRFRLFLVGMTCFLCTACVAETLYNGVPLPEPWPPADRAPSKEPMQAPWLEHPPSVIPIDVGRQLFVDDFLVETTTLQRTSHAAAYLPENPVLRPDQAWERTGDSQSQPAPTAMPFSDGAWFDPADHLFKLWYMSGYAKATAYATSKDGLHWEKPALDVVPGTNVVHTAGRDSGSVWLDQNEADAQRRYKMFLYAHHGATGNLSIFFSPDGIHWSESAGMTGMVGDRSTVFYNAFRKVWVYGIRDYAPAGIGRFRRYWESPAAAPEGAQWEKSKAPFWVGADTLDPEHPGLKTPCELYNLDAVAYESVLLGLFDIWRGQPKDRAKPNELCVGFSRDGFHWLRPTHEPFIPVSEHQGDWNWANVQSAGGCCLIVGDRLHFYVSGRSGVPGSPASGESATGLATLRRDGFVSMDANAQGGTLTTRPVQFQGKFLFINADAPHGEVRVEVLGETGQPLPGFTASDVVPMHEDGTAARIRWNGQDDLSALSGKPIRFRFHLRDARLYAFWVSPETSGASHGYVAAGGPGFTGPIDTVGRP